MRGEGNERTSVEWEIKVANNLVVSDNSRVVCCEKLMSDRR